MADFKMIATTPLDGATAQIGALTLAEYPLEAVAIATPRGGDAALNTAMEAAFGTALPAPGKSVLSSDGVHRFVWLGPDLCLAVSDRSDSDYEAAIAEAIGDAGYATLQSDNWVAVEVSGDSVQQMLERFSMFDTDPDSFAVSDARRGMTEHMNSVIIRTDDNRYLLMAASSSAQSFWGALTHTAHASEGLQALA